MPPRVKKNPGEKLDCSKRSSTSFQTYVGNLVQKKQDKIKLLLARALMNEDMLEDFHGQIHANECVFSYPDSNWYGVYLVDPDGKKYFGPNGAQKFYFQLEFQTDSEGVPYDAVPMNGTFETPPELLSNGQEIKGCVLKPSGKCGNPESKKKKKKISAVDYDSEDEETPAETLQNLTQVSTGSKQKMPRDYFEGLGSKSLIIDWMIANMKPGEIFKCIQRGSLSAEDIKQAQQILGEAPSSSSGVSEMIQSFSPSEIHGMIRIVTKEELISAANKIKNKEKKKEAIINMCKRAGVKKYKLKIGKNGKPSYIVDNEDDPVDEQEVLEECAAKEAIRLKKLIKITSISQAFKKMSKEDLMNYQGGNTPLPYKLMTFVKKYFPLVKKFENHDGLLYGSIPSVREDDTLYYFKVDDITGKDLRKLDDKIQSGTVSFGKSRKRRVRSVRSLKILRNDLKRIKKV